MEVLEDRQLMTAALAPLTDQFVPSGSGLQVPLDGSGTKSPQSFTPTSSNTDIKVSVAQGPFWTVTVSHQPASSTDVTITNESMTFQLFQDLTPITVGKITQFSTPDQTGKVFYNGTFFPRIVKGFVVQGGSPSATSTGVPSGQPGTPFANEIVPQLTFTGQGQLAMANSGGTDSNDTQFFITDGVQPLSTQQSLDYNYTLFGQLVSGQQTVTDLSKVAVQNNSPPPGHAPELSQPITPVTINAANLTSANPNGVLHIDTTSAKPGETAKITVTSTDPTDNSTATQTFSVTIAPFGNPLSVSTSINSPLTVQLSGQSGYPNTSTSTTVSYHQVSPPAHGTISPIDATTGTFVYTPDKNFLGSDSLQYEVLSPAPPPNTSASTTITSRPAVVNILVGEATGAVRLVGRVLVVTPLPRTDHGTNTIEVTQNADPTLAGGPKIVVKVNGVSDVPPTPVSEVDHIVVFGTKANDNITVDPSVTLPTTLDGGHGGKNVVKGGSGPTREHGWFGHTLLIGGTGSNSLIGRKGFVRFKPSTATKVIYAGVIKPRFKHRTVAPTGTYYRFVKGRLVPVLTT